VLDGATVHVSAGPEGLIVENRVGRPGPKLGAVGEGPRPEVPIH
jgi:ATP-dependent Clp protease ATP-binding subunit ClpB